MYGPTIIGFTPRSDDVGQLYESRCVMSRCVVGLSFLLALALSGCVGQVEMTCNDVTGQQRGYVALQQASGVCLQAGENAYQQNLNSSSGGGHGRGIYTNAMTNVVAARNYQSSIVSGCMIQYGWLCR